MRTVYYKLTNGVSEMLEVCELLVVGALFHSCTYQLCLMVASLMLLFQLPVPEEGNREGGREEKEGGREEKEGGRKKREGGKGGREEKEGGRE